MQRTQRIGERVLKPAFVGVIIRKCYIGAGFSFILRDLSRLAV